MLVGTRPSPTSGCKAPPSCSTWNKEKAFNGYTLFGVGGTSYLIDMQGRVVHTWPLGTNPRLLENGNLLDATRDDPSGFQGFQEVDWDGRVVWEYREQREGYAPHHDWVRIFNKKLGAPTTLYIANKSISDEQAIAAGADPGNGPYDGAQMDAIVEVDMQGKVVWEWCFFDHVVQDLDPAKANYVGQGKTIADYPGRINVNLPGRPPKRDWLHCNAVDYNAELGQIVTSSVQGEIYVIDHDKTFVAGDPQASIKAAAGPAGDFLYRFGDPARYAQGDPPRVLENWDSATSGDKQIGGCHDVHWIRPGTAGGRPHRDLQQRAVPLRADRRNRRSWRSIRSSTPKGTTRAVTSIRPMPATSRSASLATPTSRRNGSRSRSSGAINPRPTRRSSATSARARSACPTATR